MTLLVRDVLLEPALTLVPTLDNHLAGLGFADAQFITLGLGRINSFHPSGRAFLQSARQRDLTDVSLKAYFGAASSPRRLAMIHELNTTLSQRIGTPVDRFAVFAELAGRDVLALDGHDVRHGTHEPAATMASGRREVPGTVTGVFLRNLRTGAARVLAQTEGHQHEWAAVKARPWSDFHWKPRAKGTILVIDPVAVDFAFLRGAKFKGGFTVITRTKANLVVREARPVAWDKKHRHNRGVLSDERVQFAEGGEFRRIRYRDPESGEVYEFLTTEFHLAPGIIAQLYRLRWDIEKFFDVCENLLAEKRAWGSGPVPAQVQNEFLVLAHNLLLILNGKLEAEEGIRDEKVEMKYEAALKQRAAVARSNGRTVSPWVRVLRRITRWSSQFTRWIQDAIVHGWEWQQGIAKLRPLMLAYLR
ncbi:MAG: transposase [Verrucomicrobia bacterium]|nr:transposase [Verrucomicrobiota bacterium]